jgi:hypothetical protein
MQHCNGGTILRFQAKYDAPKLPSCQFPLPLSVFFEFCRERERPKESERACRGLYRDIATRNTYLPRAKGIQPSGRLSTTPGTRGSNTRGALAVSTLPASVGRMSTAAPARPVRSPVKTRRQSRNTSERSSERDRSERDSLAAASRERNHVDSFKLRRVVVNKKLVS